MGTVHDTNSTIVKKDGKILLIRRNNPPGIGLWAPPGGHFNEGETPQEAAQREAQEEAGGIEVERLLFVFMHEVLPGERRHPEPHEHRCHVFLGKVTGEIKAGSDAEEFRWFSPEELKNLKLTHYAEKIFRRMGYI